MHSRYKKCDKMLVGKPEENKTTQKTILKQILRRQCGRVWTEFM